MSEQQRDRNPSHDHRASLGQCDSHDQCASHDRNSSDGAQPKLLRPTDAAQLRGAWRSPFHADTKLLVEVGTWNGSMLRAAVLHESISPSPPQILCVGIDWKRKTLIEAIHAIDIVPDQRRQHVRFVLGRAQDMPDWFAPGEIDEIWILHPEPSDRPQERAHRLVNANFLLSIAALLKIGGTIHIKTDHAGLYAWILGLFGIDAPAHFSNPAQDRNARDVDGRRLRVRQRDLLAEDDRSTCDDTLVRVLSIIGQSHDFWSDIERAGASAGVPAGHVLTRYMSGYEQRFVARGRPIYAISAQRADPARLCP